MARKLVTIARYFDYFEANIAKSALEENGIVAVIMGENLANAVGIAPALANVELQVNEADAEAALEILEDIDSPPDLLNPYEDGFEDGDDESEEN